MIEPDTVSQIDWQKWSTIGTIAAALAAVAAAIIALFKDALVHLVIKQRPHISLLSAEGESTTIRYPGSPPKSLSGKFFHLRIRKGQLCETMYGFHLAWRSLKINYLDEDRTQNWCGLWP